MTGAKQDYKRKEAKTMNEFYDVISSHSRKDLKILLNIPRKSATDWQVINLLEDVCGFIEQLKEREKKGGAMSKVTIEYDPQTGSGAAFFEGSRLCDIVLPEAHAKSIRELVAERIKEMEASR